MSNCNILERMYHYVPWNDFLPFPFLSSMYLIDNSVSSRFIHDNIIKMETFSALLAVCEGNSLVTSKFPSQRPVTWSFNGFFDLRLKKWSKQVTRWWCQMPLCRLWHYINSPVTQYDKNSIEPLSFICTMMVKHIEAETKWTPFHRRHFQAHFPE